MDGEGPKAPWEKGRFRNVDPDAGDRPFRTALRWMLTRKPQGSDPLRREAAPYPREQLAPGELRRGFVNSGKFWGQLPIT